MRMAASIVGEASTRSTRRHDYNVNLAGGFGASQLTSDYTVANGIPRPTKCRAYARGPDRRPTFDMLMVAIDISDVSFS